MDKLNLTEEQILFNQNYIDDQYEKTYKIDYKKGIHNVDLTFDMVVEDYKENMKHKLMCMGYG